MIQTEHNNNKNIFHQLYYITKYNTFTVKKLPELLHLYFIK